jgi:hypothetical protein
MNNLHEIASSKPAENKTFAGYPYLAVFIAPGIAPIILLPRTWEIERYIEFARRQVQANQFLACLLFEDDFCLYFLEDGSGCRSNEIPHNIHVFSEKLVPVEPIPDSNELTVRRMELRLFEEAQGPWASVFLGDITKYGRFPTPEEIERLAGTHAEGIPKGLLPCLQCGEWRGECFDTLGQSLVVRVHCPCENDSRCAGCGALFDSKKLNANYFDPVDRKIYHVPALAVLQHVCDRGIGRLSREGRKA